MNWTTTLIPFVLLGGVIAILCFAAIKTMESVREAKTESVDNPSRVLSDHGVRHAVIDLPSGERFLIVSSYRGVAFAQIMPVKP